jgi:hypothetical protein
VRISATERARVSRQCVVSRELAGPKNNLNRVVRMGNWLIFQCLGRSLRPLPLLQDRASRTVVLSKYSSLGECRNGENLDEV